MKQKLQGLIAGALIGATITGGTVIAKNGNEMIEALYNNIKIYVDGVKIEPKDANGNSVEPFIYNGTTYLPVRAVGEAIGKQVSWDGSTQSVYIGQKPGGNEYLTAISPAYQTGGNAYKEYSSYKSGGTESFSMAGIKYTDGMTFNADINVINDVSWAIYNLNSSYKTLAFTVGHVDNTYNGDSTVMQIFYDGKLEKEVELSPDMYPEKVSLNVNGVNQLKIQVLSSGSDNPCMV